MDSATTEKSSDTFSPLPNVPPCDEAWYKDIDKKVHQKAGKNVVRWTSSRKGGYRVLLEGMGLPYNIAEAIMAKASGLLPSGPALKMNIAENQKVVEIQADKLQTDEKLGRYFQWEWRPKSEWKKANEFYLLAPYRWLLVANDERRKRQKKEQTEDGDKPAQAKAKRKAQYQGELVQGTTKRRRRSPTYSSASSLSTATDAGSDFDTYNPRSQASTSSLPSTQPSSTISGRRGLKTAKRPQSRASAGRLSNLTHSSDLQRSGRFSQSSLEGSRTASKTACDEPERADIEEVENWEERDPLEVWTRATELDKTGTTEKNDGEAIEGAAKTLHPFQASDQATTGFDHPDTQSGMTSNGAGEEEDVKYIILDEADTQSPYSLQNSLPPNTLQLRSLENHLLATVVCLDDLFDTENTPPPSKINIKGISSYWNSYLKSRNLPTVDDELLHFKFMWADLPNHELDVINDLALKMAYRLWLSLGNAHHPLRPACG